MKRNIAIYSGVIPSTTFIENLIASLAQGDNKILLFGRISEKHPAYNDAVFIYPTPTGNWQTLLFVLLNMTGLYLRSKNKFNLLYQHIKSLDATFGQRISFWGKYLPVVNHLPDVFHVQWTNSAEEWMFLKRLFGVKVIISFRGAQLTIAPIVNKSYEENYKKLFPEADGFHAVSKAIANQAGNYHAGIEKIKVVYSGIDFPKIMPFEKKEFSVASPVHLLSIGRYHWTKGYNYALDALHQMSKEGIDFKYTIVTNALPEEIIYQISEFQLHDKIEVLGKMPQTDVFNLMRKSDILLLPSVEEGIANVVLEAMALGLPVVSSNCGGMTEVIDHGKNGMLFKNRDTKDLALRLKEMILLNAEERSAIASAAKIKVAQQHSMAQLRDGMNKLYDSVLCE